MSESAAGRGRARFLGAAGALRERVGALSGWRRYGMSCLLGALTALAMPPWHAVPLLFLAFPALLWQIETAGRPRIAFLVGLAFGFGHFLVGVQWIANAFLVDAERFAWLVPVAIPGLALYLALFPAATTLLFRLLRSSFAARGWSGALLFALLWTGTEWLRGELLTGFPWTPVGLVWAVSDAMLQGAAFFGVFGLSFFTVLAAALPAFLAERGRCCRLLPLLAACLLMAGLWFGGMARLARAEAAFFPGVHLRLVQPGIPQSLKWDPALREQHFERHLALTLGEGFARATLVVWPEMAAPYFLAEDPERRARLAHAVPKGGLLLTGAPRLPPEAAEPSRGFSNGLVALDGQGRILGGYDKFHLVPFGEFVPLRDVLPLPRLVPGIGDFYRGPGPQTLILPGLPPLSPLICYEVIFSGEVVGKALPPRWLLNVTNDAWFGESSGPYQHFAAARFRAVEEGLALVRVANTGVSAIIDPYGRVLERLDLGAVGVLDGPLPAPLDPAPLYGRLHGKALGLLLAAGLGLLGLRRILRRPGGKIS